MIFVAAVAVLPVPRGSGVTLVTVAVSRIVPLFALTVTLMWMRPASPDLSVPRWHITVAPRVPALEEEHCPLVAEALRKVARRGGGRRPSPAMHPMARRQ